ncbi:MAG: U32 family peptidase C-terminal domain-containing protein [Alphaproteobacteria bacterium]|jgi:putative protease|nr:U32 family peptidase C-terminal domain-containing protein [Alphaproteobacteria bacterium]
MVKNVENAHSCGCGSKNENDGSCSSQSETCCKRSTYKKPENHRAELLMPAGDLRRLKTAILYGADAVYAGTPAFSLRSKSKFTLEDLKEGARFVREHGKKIYLTLNLYSHNADIDRLPHFTKVINEVQPDGVIIADPGVFNYVKKECPGVELHISTQANVCSWTTVDFWKEQGASLCVLGREVNGEEITKIREMSPDIKLEYFVHGAMCMAYSGRCLLSNYMAERGANQGKCAHSCRWKYKVYLEEEERPGEFYAMEEDEKGSYIMNSRDMCLMPRLDTLLNIGIDSLKIEGRNKSEYYAGSVARVYRKAIDDYYADPENWDAQKYMPELHTLQNRGYTLGFFDGKLTNVAHNYETTRSTGAYRVAGFVREFTEDSLVFELRNTVFKGDEIEFLSPVQYEPIVMKLDKLIDFKNGLELEEKVSAGHEKAIMIPFAEFEKLGIKDVKSILPELSLARKKLPLTDSDIEFLEKHSSGEDELKAKIK